MLAGFFKAALTRGMNDLLQRYAVPLALGTGIAGRFFYVQPQLFGSDGPDVAPPTSSEMVPYVDAGRRVLEQRIWQYDMDRWSEEVKPRSVDQHLALLEVEPSDLSDESLVNYLRVVQQHWEEMWVQHHHFNAAAIAPTGKFLLHVMNWTGMEPPEILLVLQGATPISQGLSDEIITLLEAIHVDQGSAAASDDEDPGSALEALAQRPGATGEAARRFLLVDGERMADGFDIGDQRAIEVPELLVQRLRAGLDRLQLDDATADAVAAMRDRVPGEHRDRFDALLGEARALSRLRDERGLYSDGLAAAVVRRAVLEAGARLAARGRVEQADHAVEADIDELSALLWGLGGPEAGVLTQRFTTRTTQTWRDAPSVLGEELGAPTAGPDYPPEPARLATDFLTVLFLALPDPFTAVPERLWGITVSRGVYEGTARLLAEPAGLERIRPGDILITSSHA